MNEGREGKGARTGKRRGGGGEVTDLPASHPCLRQFIDRAHVQRSKKRGGITDLTGYHNNKQQL